MTRGAHECLKVLVWHMKRGNFDPPQKSLARTLKRSVAQLAKYLKELKELKLVTVKQGGDGQYAHYILTPGAVEIAAQSRELSRKLSRELKPDSPSSIAPDFSELHGKSRELNTPASKHLKNLFIKTGDPSSVVVGNGSAPRPTPRFEKKEEEEAVWRAVGGCEFPINRAELMANLARQAEFYGVNGFVIAAEIQRARNRVLRKPSLHPRSQRWFTAVVEEALRPESRQEKPASERKPAAAEHKPDTAADKKALVRAFGWSP